MNTLNDIDSYSIIIDSGMVHCVRNEKPVAKEAPQDTIVL